MPNTITSDPGTDKEKHGGQGQIWGVPPSGCSFMSPVRESLLPLLPQPVTSKPRLVPWLPVSVSIQGPLAQKWNTSTIIPLCSSATALPSIINEESRWKLRKNKAKLESGKSKRTAWGGPGLTAADSYQTNPVPCSKLCLLNKLASSSVAARQPPSAEAAAAATMLPLRWLSWRWGTITEHQGCRQWHGCQALDEGPHPRGHRTASLRLPSCSRFQRARHLLWRKVDYCVRNLPCKSEEISRSTRSSPGEAGASVWIPCARKWGLFLQKRGLIWSCMFLKTWWGFSSRNCETPSLQDSGC